MLSDSALKFSKGPTTIQENLLIFRKYLSPKPHNFCSKCEVILSYNFRSFEIGGIRPGMRRAQK